MPREVRHLLFSEREVCQMVFDMLASRGDKRTATGARVVFGESDGEMFVRMEHSGAETSERQMVSLCGRDALAASVLFCRTHGVPLPMRADKHLTIVRGQLALVLTSAPRAS